MGAKYVPRRIVASFDTETTNITNLLGVTSAFFTLYQICEFLADDIRDATPVNIEYQTATYLYRSIDPVWHHLLCIADRADGYIPVVAVHNLQFDFYALAEYLNRWNVAHDVTVLAKSLTKPITITLMKDDRPYLVFWDTLEFSGKGLERMGKECGFAKAVGSWDYERIRTPETELTDDELEYATKDCLALLCWLGYFFRREPLLNPEMVAYTLCTKTGVVRAKRSALFGKIKGRGLKESVSSYWIKLNNSQALRTDPELFTFHICTRGGFTFAAREHAGRPIIANDDQTILAFDATSQHPAQIVSHFIPVNFEEVAPDILDIDAQIIEATSLEDVLSNFDRPFPVAFDACFEFTNLRLKDGTIFKRDGISSLSSDRISVKDFADEEYAATIKLMRRLGYCDSIDGLYEHSFGKIFEADNITLWLTELDYWIVCQIFDFDEVKALCGYETAKFIRPSDMSVLSVMEFYRRKDILKEALKRYRAGERNFKDLKNILPDYFIEDLQQNRADEVDLMNYYNSAKADLNSLYGIEITDEAKRDIVLTPDGLNYDGEYSAENLKDKPKACYQFGQRIVGWSRIAQTIVLMLIGPLSEAVINGDTDSVKVLVNKSNIDPINQQLAKYANAIDKAKSIVTARIKRCYPKFNNQLTGIGHYVADGEYRRFFSAYNKAYLHDDYKITLAGVPSWYKGRDEAYGLEAWARDYEIQGHSWEEVAGTVLGYNVTISANITGLNGRNVPKWGQRWQGSVTDWRGNTAQVTEPCAIGIAPMQKTIGDFRLGENRINSVIAARHGAVNLEPVLIDWDECGHAELIKVNEVIRWD